MRPRAIAALIHAICAGWTPAQNYDELPAGFTQVVDLIYDPYLIPASSWLPMHVQYVYDTNDVPVGAASIRELAWHRNNHWSNALPAGSVTWTVVMALSPNAPAAMSNTFASNLVHVVTQVFQGTANFPSTAKGSGPAPYDQKLLLTAPYPYTKAGNLSLVVDIVTTSLTGYANSTYIIDASAPDAGIRFDNGSAQPQCKFSNGSHNSSLSYSIAGLNNNGGTWFVQYGGILPNAAGVAILSLFGLDNPGSWPLPLNLAPIGAPTCNWHVGFDLPTFHFAITANTSGSARLQNVSLPPGFGGLEFYDQAWFLDAAAPGGIVTGWSSKWHVGTLKGPIANTLYRTADTGGSPTGTIRTGYGTHIRLTR